MPALLAAVLAVATHGTAQGAPAAPPAWAEVRAVLTARCLECHGGDKVKSGFRLATAATFAAGGFRGPAVDRDDPLRSRLLHAIGYRDPELSMPPSGRLPDPEIELLTRWVLAGAPWPADETGRLADPDRHREASVDADAARDWWAYRPLSTPPRPIVDGATHPVDSFLWDRLARAGLTPAAAAEPTALLRRTTFALTGLPPTPEEVTAFLAAAAHDPDAAFADLVERLLASPAYGEHMARHWLDLVRYADTNGYERDAAKPNVWRYRDWVIRAFQRDLPYDQFVIDQLAGDELGGGDGADAEQMAAERLLATGYYRLGVWDDEPADREQARADEIADIVDTTGQVFLATTLGCARCHDHKADPISQRDYYAFTASFNHIAGYSAERTRSVADRPGSGQMTVDQRRAAVAAVDAALAPLLAQLRDAAIVRGASAASRVLVADARDQAAVWRHHQGAVPEDWPAQAFDDRGWAEGRAGFGRGGTPGARVGTRWHGPQIHLRTRFLLTEIPDALVLTLHHDEDVAIYLNGALVLERRGYRTDYTEVQLPAEAVAALVVGSNVLAVSCRQTGGGQYIDVGLRTGWLGEGDEAWRQRLQREGAALLPAAAAAEGQRLLAERQRLLAAPVAEPYPALVVAEREGPPPQQHVLHRGSAHAPGDPVAPGVPAVLRTVAGTGDPAPAAVADGVRSSGRRLALARWLVRDARFLTARVMANRVWQWLFGRGLCRSSGDFGRLGEPPTHPELLDHLANELIARGWSTKALVRYLTTSRSFRMAATATGPGRDQDPRNDLFWRFEPRRLRAEEYRDAVLALSGELDLRRFGPPVQPPLPPEVLATSSKPGEVWQPSPPADAARRSVYVLCKRSLRLPVLEALDQPDPDMPCAERFPTNVPTQALMTLNGAFTGAAARRLAQRLLRESSHLDGRIERGIWLALGRAPAPGEVARHRVFVQRMVGEHGQDQAAALALFALLLCNLNEFLWVD